MHGHVVVIALPDKAIGVPVMMSLLAALNTLAAARGEGLRPELIRLLNHPRAGSGEESASMTAEGYETPRIVSFASDVDHADTDPSLKPK